MMTTGKQYCPRTRRAEDDCIDPVVPGLYCSNIACQAWRNHEVWCRLPAPTDDPDIGNIDIYTTDIM